MWQDSKGCSALSLCCQNGHANVCELLYKHGSSVDFLYRKDGAVCFGVPFLSLKGALHIACQNGHLAVIKFLLSKKADINKQNHQRVTPLHFAIKGNHFLACQLILGYEEVSSQSVESGITLTKIYNKTPEIRALLEKTLKSRRKVILV